MQYLACNRCEQPAKFAVQYMDNDGAMLCTACAQILADDNPRLVVVITPLQTKPELAAPFKAQLEKLLSK